MQNRSFASLEDDGRLLAMNDAGEVIRRSHSAFRIPQSSRESGRLDGFYDFHRPLGTFGNGDGVVVDDLAFQGVVEA